MYSLIKFYFKLPDTKLNVRMEPSVLYPLARMGNVSLPCRNPRQGNENKDPSQTGQGKEQGWCGMAEFVPWLVPFCLSSVETGTGTIIINGSEHLLSKPGETILWGFYLCFLSPTISCLGQITSSSTELQSLRDMLHLGFLPCQDM